MSFLLYVVGNGMTPRRPGSSLSEFLVATVLILLTSTQCLAHLSCYPMIYPGEVNSRFIVPNLADCQRVLASLPSIVPNARHDPDTRIPKALPFLPPFFIRHGTCQLELSWVAAAGFGRPGVVLMDRIMADFRAGAERIVTECVALGGQSGEFHSDMEHDGQKAIRTHVSTTTFRAAREQQDICIESQRARIGQSRRGHSMAVPNYWTGDDSFRYTTYEV